MRSLSSQELSQRLAERGAVLADDHVVLTEKPDGFYHSSSYFDKDRVLSDPACLWTIAEAMADYFRDQVVFDAVIGPTVGGVGLAAALACVMYQKHGIELKAWGYAEEATEEMSFLRIGERGVASTDIEKMLVPRPGRRVVKRCFPNFIRDKRVLVVEDVVTSGGSALATIEAVRQVGALVAGLGLICDRKGLSREDLGVQYLYKVFNLPMVTYREETCPLCAAGVPINMSVGHGAKFYTRHPESQVPKK